MKHVDYAQGVASFVDPHSGNRIELGNTNSHEGRLALQGVLSCLPMESEDTEGFYIPQALHNDLVESSQPAEGLLNSVLYHPSIVEWTEMHPVRIHESKQTKLAREARASEAGKSVGRRSRRGTKDGNGSKLSRTVGSQERGADLLARANRWLAEN